MILWVILIMGLTFYIDLVLTCAGGGGGGYHGSGGGKKPSNVTNDTTTTTTKRPKRTTKPPSKIKFITILRNINKTVNSSGPVMRANYRNSAQRNLDTQMPGFPVPADMLKNWTDWVNRYQENQKADKAAYQDNTYPWGTGGDDDYYGAGGPFGGAGGAFGGAGGMFGGGPGFGNHWGPGGFGAGKLGAGGKGKPGSRYGDTQFVMGPNGKLIRRPNLHEIWPKEWKGLGKPDLGFPPQEPPQFAMAPVNVGLPSYCYLPLDNGTCPKEVIQPKWFYNAYLNECFEFEYTGCNGNNNRFNTEKKCLAKCNIDDIPTGCEEKSKLKAHYLKDFDGTDPFIEGRKQACGPKKSLYPDELVDEY